MTTTICEKTMSGKHMWEEVFDGYDEEKTKKANKANKSDYPTMILVPKTAIKCKACGIYNDT